MREFAVNVRHVSGVWLVTPQATGSIVDNDFGH
jgi:hypothetical protein